MEIEYSVVIPVYNSSKWLEELLLQIEQVMDNVGEVYEIVLVNDGSPQKETWPVMKNLCGKLPRLKVIDLQYNSGQLNALLCGLKNAQGRYIITMDDDFQHDPFEIPKLIQKMQETDCDCVLAQYEHKEHGAIRKLGSAMVNHILQKVCGKPKDITSNSFRIMKKELADALVQYKGKSPHIGVLIFSATKNVETVLVKHKERLYGKSGYSAKRLVRETVNLILNGTTFPLDVVSIGGIMVSGIAFIIAVVYFILYVIGYVKVSGFTALILTISFFSGVILFVLGILGKYIGRLIEEVIGLPAYKEREIAQSDIIKKDPAEEKRSELNETE